MSRRPTSTVGFDALTIEGGLIAPEMLNRIGSVKAGEQAEADYGLDPGVKIRDEIGFAFSFAETLWARFRQGGTVERFAEDLLRQVFGFRSLARVTAPEAEGGTWPIQWTALSDRVPVVIAPPPDENSRRSGLDESHVVFGDGNRRRSATLLVQEFLNASDGAMWGVATDGQSLRILRDNASLTRPAWIEADIARILGERMFADFSVLWLLLHESRFGKAGSAPADCPLERWREAGRTEGVKARERLSISVEAALGQLGNGFLKHVDNSALREAITTGALTRQAYFQELLRLVYRFIFLFTAEDRNLLHPRGAKDEARLLYAEGYSLGRLRERAIRRTAYDRHYDLYEGVKLTTRKLADGEPKLALPALGALFLPGSTLHLDNARLANRDLLAALYRLAWLPMEGRLERVNWRDMETEELGSVYESLLELAPQVSDGAINFKFASGAEGKGNARKTSGSYYTPDSLVQLLLDSALDPVIEAAIKTNPGKEVEALLDLNVIDPACGSGHFLLAAARRIASRIAQFQSPGAPSAEDYRRALREVARHCLYGVDRNPMAVELCKVALWIETVEPGKPLSFLDGRIRQGDSLIGVFDVEMLGDGIPDEAYKALTGDDKAVAKHFAVRNRKERKDRPSLPFAGSLAKLASRSRSIDGMAEDDLADVRKKAEAEAALRNTPESWLLKVACDLFVTAFFAPKTGELPSNAHTVTIPTTDHLWSKLAGLQIHGPLETVGIDIADRVSAFHWPLEFPEVFASGGFDCVIGNPPWEVSELNEAEYFGKHAPDIAQMKGKKRKQAIRTLESSNPHVWQQFVVDKRLYESANIFYKNCRRFLLTARGKINTFALFSDMAAQLLPNAESHKGRAGLVVPTAIATDAPTSMFFNWISDEGRLIQFLDFQTGRGFFDDIGHARFKFALMTLGSPGSTPKEGALMAFFLREISDLTQMERFFRLSPSEIGAINPNTKTLPIFRSRTDAALTAKICLRFPVLIATNEGDEHSDYEPIIILNFFSSSNDDDAELFESIEVCHDENYVPVLKGSSIYQYDNRFANYSAELDGYVCCSDQEKLHFELITRSDRYVPICEVRRRLHEKGWTREWLIGWRDITNAGNERTVISSALPIQGADDTLSLLLPAVENVRNAAVLLAILNSMTLDYIAQQKVGGSHIRKHVISQFPVPSPSALAPNDVEFIVSRVIELTYTNYSMQCFARDLGYEGQPFKWDEDRRAQLRADLDAKIARLYGLTRDELRFILDPADVMGADYPTETFRVLKENETRRFGEYRTRRLVLEAWDRMAAMAAEEKVVTLPTPMRQPRPLPDMRTIGDSAWARPMANPRGETMEVLLAILAAMDRSMSAERVRLAALLALEPHLLGPHLEVDQATDWARVIGGEAVGPVADSDELAGHWGAAVRHLRSRGWLDDASGNWGVGNSTGAPQPGDWAAGRAAITWDAMRRIGDKAEVINLFSAQFERWRNAEAA